MPEKKTPPVMPRQPFPFIGRDPTPEEEAEWKRLEDLRLSTPTGVRTLCTSQDKQDRYVHSLLVFRSSCWLCGHPVNRYEACRALHFPSPPPEQRCLNCNVRMNDVVPFVSMGAPWHWARPKDMTIPEILRTLEASRPIWGADTLVDMHEQEIIRLDGLEYLGFEGPMTLVIGRKFADDAELSAMLSFDGGWADHPHAAGNIAEGLRALAEAMDERPWPSEAS